MRGIVEVVFTCCDESEGNRWWVYGAIWLPRDDRLPKYEADVTALRQRTNCWGEFKWEKLSPKHLPAYEEFVCLSLALQSVRFSTIVVDTKLFTKDDMDKYHGQGGRDLAYLKFMRQLLKGRILRFASKDNPDHVVLYDKLPMDEELVSDFRSYLKYDMGRISSRKGFDVRFTHLSQADSKILNLMQAADLLTGATCWAWEGGTGSGGRANARRAIRKQIEEWAKGDLTNDSFYAGRYYSAWRWEPSS